MKKLGLFSFYGAALLCMALFVNSCSKDDISVNINWTEEYPQTDTNSGSDSSTDKDSNSSGSGSGTGTGTGTGDGSSTTKEKISMFFKANVRGVFAVSSTSVKPISAGRYIMIDAYSAGNRIASQTYTSTASGSLTSTSGDTLSVPTGTYDFYAVGINASDATVPTFSASGICSSLSNQTDYIWWDDIAYTPTYPSSTITMNMQHCCTQVVVYVTPGTGITISDVTGMNITPSNTSGCTWSLLTGIITPATAITSTTATMGVAASGTEYVGQIIMLPLKMTGNMTLSFSATLSGETAARNYTASLPVYENNMEAAHSYKYTVTLYENEVVISSVNIIDWISVTANSTPIIPTQSTRK